MEENVTCFTNNTASDEELINEVQDLIFRFQDPDLSMKDREEIFNKIIQLTDQLTD